MAPMKPMREAAARAATSSLDWQSLPAPRAAMGVILVDHGSRREESNALLEQMVELYRRVSPFPTVLPAHMELAEPTLGQAFDACVVRGCRLVVIHPYFLLPGRHWAEDIPRLAAEAAARHAGIGYLVTAPLGIHAFMAEVIQVRVEQCLAHASGQTDGCLLCQGSQRCQFSGTLREESA